MVRSSKEEPDEEGGSVKPELSGWALQRKWPLTAPWTWVAGGERTGEGIPGGGRYCCSEDSEMHGIRFCLTRDEGAAKGSADHTRPWRVWVQFVESWRTPGRLLPENGPRGRPGYSSVSFLNSVIWNLLCL